jgi:hypothetical protein
MATLQSWFECKKVSGLEERKYIATLLVLKDKIWLRDKVPWIVWVVTECAAYTSHCFKSEVWFWEEITRNITNQLFEGFQEVKPHSFYNVWHMISAAQHSNYIKGSKRSLVRKSSTKFSTEMTKRQYIPLPNTYFTANVTGSTVLHAIQSTSIYKTF